MLAPDMRLEGWVGQVVLRYLHQVLALNQELGLNLDEQLRFVILVLMKSVLQLKTVLFLDLLPAQQLQQPE